MITNKYILDDDNSTIIDTETGEFLTNTSICYQLNEYDYENYKLKKELQRLYDTATVNKTISILESYYDKLLSQGSDEIKDAKRRTVLKCIEELEIFKEEEL